MTILTYDELLDVADHLDLLVKEKPLKGYDGRIKGHKIAIRKDIPTLKEKSCILAEEIGHYLTTSGNILDQDNECNRKQEYKARATAYDIQIGLTGIIDAYESGCTSSYMMADYLGVTETFLSDAMEYYRRKHGVYTRLSSYVIYFEPSIGVMRMI